MADTATRKTAGKNGATTPTMPPFPMNGELMSTLTQASQQFVANAVSFNEEVARFANQRLKANVKRFEGLSKCGSFEDAFSMQTDFARKMIEDYTQELPKLAETATRGYLDTWKNSVETMEALGSDPQVPFGD